MLVEIDALSFDSVSFAARKTLSFYPVGAITVRRALLDGRRRHFVSVHREV